MQDTAGRAIAIVGVSAILPDAPDAASFWRNVKDGRYSIGEVPPERWDPALYYDADPSVPDKTYSKIGGWVRQWDWEPMKWRLPIPPKVADAMDDGQKWAVACARSALLDYGEDRPLDRERTAVVIGNALAGEKHYLTALRIFLPEYAAALSASPSFASLDPQARERIAREMHDQIAGRFAESTEDTMPGELANCMAGRIANLFDFRGPNFVCDAACAAALAALDAAVEGLVEQEYDAALVGGVDRNMGAPAFVKFCKIGALSATGTRPYADGADGFVMGEGAAFFLLKRLEDAEAAGDRIYAVVRGVGGSSDGKGKGITAPNPVGQRLAIERAWRNAGLSPASVGLVEGHGTSTRVGDVVEVQSLTEVFGRAGLAPGSVPLGSVKSNIGHLKGAAGAAGLLKTIFALHEKVLPPSLNFERPNPNIDFAHSPFYVNTDLKPWDPPADGVRRAGVSAFGFGGTNFHAVLEEYVPGRLARRTAQADVPGRVAAATRDVAQARAPRRGALVLGAPDVAALSERLAAVEREARAGRAPETQAPTQADLRAPERLAIDYGDAAELATRAGRAARALAGDEPAAWKALRAQGVFRGSGHPTPVAFLYTGQGSQYVNMLRELREHEPVVAETFDEADRVLRPLLDRPLTDYVFADPTDAEACARAEEALKRTEITQPAVLTVDVALTRLFAAHGIEPDMVMGHSLGEYGALVASGALPFADALEAVSARGGEMARLTTEDNGRMAAVLGPLEQIERVLEGVDGYVVIANLNSTSQAVIGGASEAVERAMRACADAGLQAVPLPVSHAFHTAIVAPASEPLRRTLERLHLAPPGIPLVANLNGDFYPMDTNAVPRMLDLLAAQVSSPVQFVKGLETLYASGARAFVEVGPKKALHGFVEDVLGAREGVLPLFANHPKVGDLASFNQALCGLYAAGRGVARDAATTRQAPVPREVSPATAAPTAAPAAVGALPADRVEELGRLFAEFLERGWRVYRGDGEAPAASEAPVVTGAALGLPGAARVFDDDHVQRILDGEQGIDVIPARFRNAMVEKHITRLVKSADGPHFETIEHPTEVIKLAARAGAFDLEREFGVDRERIAAFDVTTRLAVAAGLEALRDAGIPLVMRYRTTHKGTRIPERWVLPEGLRDETGVIFASAFPGFDAFARELTRQQTEHGLHQQIEALESLLARVVEEADGHDVLRDEIERRLHELRARLEHEPYVFDRRFLFRVLPMAHAQLAELIGARGPNTHVNSACASTTQAFALAEDWIRAGRCRRVVVVAADDVTTDDLLEWFASGFLATGAAATDDVVEEAALPFDRRRHGMILGMGAAAAVVESPACARERGLRPICEVISTVTANSAFHGTRLDVDHIQRAMEQLVAQAERRFGLDRRAMAREMVFVSHETYTPARGGSAAAEVHALRQVFGPDADHVVVANTKGFTGHPMGVGIEDVVAIKALETGVVPPVPNYREPDPDLGRLHLSRGGAYPIRYALRLGAGFGSQISFSLLRWVPGPDGARPSPDELGYAARIRDAGAWSAWLRTLSGDASPELEVVNRTLRLKDRGAPASEPAPEVRPAAAAPIRAAAPAEPRPEPAPEGGDPVRERVLGIVGDKTGYPRDMLDLDLDLEADLGIDTVKQAETFAAIREAYQIPRDDALRLRDYPTLAHAIRFVKERRPDLAETAPAPASPTAPAPPAPEALAPEAPHDDPVRERVLGIVGDKTGYPRDMLDLDLDLEADLGIDTVKQAETFAAIREAYEIPRDDALRLRDYPTLAHAIRFVKERRPDLAETAPAPASPTAPAPPAPEAPAPEAPHDDPVRERVLGIVGDKTGYPRDMLDLDLDLEADLGIDTVKQAETFAAIREAYQIPRDDALRLRDYPTLAHAIRFVKERRPDLAETAPAPAPAPEPPTATERASVPETEADADAPRSDLEAARRIPRRVPRAVLRPALERCEPTGVELGGTSRVLVVMDQGGVGRALVRRLEKLGVRTETVEDAPDRETLAGRLEAWSREGPFQGVYWLPALDAEGDLRELEPAQWRAALHLRVKLLHETMRALGETIGPSGTFLVAATRLGGRHGYEATGAVAPLGGAVTGFAKAFQRERPEALVKAVDFGPSRRTAELADALLAETRRDPGAVEVGVRDGLRWSVGLVEEPLADEAAGLALGRESVFLVTGAAGSIVSAITADLAAASGGTFHLLDLVPEPRADDADLVRFAHDRDGLQRELFERLKARGERATPARVERELARLERAQACLAAIQAVRRAGGTAHYHQVDLTDAEAVAKLADDVRARHERVDVLLHAAGLERSRRLQDKDAGEFDLIFDVKADGWFNLVHALGELPLGAVVAFSSIAGRFGNAGQTDYSAANDLLCKCVSSLRRTRPETQALAIDWTAWARIGMASRGSIPQVMERVGIDMLAPEAGIPIVGRELRGGTRGEVLIGERLGFLLQDRDERGGLDASVLAPGAESPLLGRVLRMGPESGLCVETRLDPAAQPFLDHHRIDGTPVLPGVMGIEAFAELAAWAAPGWQVRGLEEVAFLAPFKFYRDEPRILELNARLEPDGDEILAHCSLAGRRELPGRGEPQRTTHFTARVRLARTLLGAESGSPAPKPRPDAARADAVYRVYFHGPAYRVLERAWGADGTAFGRLAAALPDDHHPADTPLRTLPRLVELCFQTAGIWEIGTHGRMALPRGIGRLSFPGRPAASAPPLHAVVRAGPEGSGFEAEVVDAAGAVWVRLEGYATAALPAGVDGELRAPLAAAMR